MRHLHTFPLDVAGSSPATPLRPDEALSRLHAGRRPFLLDGATHADGLGRYSYASCDPIGSFCRDELPPCHLPSTQPRVLLRPAGQPQASALPVAAPLWQALQDQIDAWHPAVAVGFLDYELGRLSEQIPTIARPHPLGTPVLDFAAYRAVYRYDAHRDYADLLAVSPDDAAHLRAYLAQPAPPPIPLRAGPLRSLMSPAVHAACVRTIVHELSLGNCYQVNLCRWLRADLPQPCALAAYLRLRTVAPAPLGAFLRLDGAHNDPRSAPVLLSNSPELFLAFDRAAGHVETRPIKGTRRRHPDPSTDAALARALCDSPKDRAEHLMIVDLLRNDLGRIAEVGSVAVEGLLRCVSLPTVHHLITTVSARPLQEVRLSQLLSALHPGGSITGAPKLAAMALIDRLEPVRRGPFYGALGWLTSDAGQLALCIRTAVVAHDQLTLAVGGGIVLDSTPDDEWHETEAKAAAFVQALRPG